MVHPRSVRQVNLSGNRHYTFWRVNVHWYSPAGGTLHPCSICSLTRSWNWLQGLSASTKKKKPREKVRRFLLLASHRSALSLSTCVRLSSPLSLSHSCLLLFFRCGFSQTKCSSRPQEWQRGIHRCLEAERLPHPTAPGNRSERLIPGLLWWLIGPGSVDHVLAIFVIFTIRRNCRGSQQRNWVITAEKNAAHCLILLSLLLK